MTVVSIHQPAYLPWLGYFHKLLLSDVFVVLDSTQFEKNSFINRNRIRTAQGAQWLTIPMLTRGHLDKAICEMAWDSTSGWQRKHLETLQQAYRRAPFFDRYYPILQTGIEAATDFSALLFEMLGCLASELGSQTRLVRSSRQSVTGKKSELILNLCRSFGADVYVSGVRGADYLDREAFAAASVRVWIQRYQHPEYCQSHAPFVPNLSVVDCLMHHGPEATRGIIFAGNATRQDIVA